MNMKVIAKTGREDIAIVYIAKTASGKLIEFVESVPTSFSRHEKWVLVLSTLFGCPGACKFCDAGSEYEGKLSVNELLYQVEYAVLKYFPDRIVPSKKFKIQFSRMGEPSFNTNVLEALEQLPERITAPGLIISLSTIAPQGREKFFQKLIAIKDAHYRGRFQFQFSLHSTSSEYRSWLIPQRTWSFGQMADYGTAFLSTDDKKITLNFAMTDATEIDPDILLRHFSPEKFLVKITPVNPTYSANRNNISYGSLPLQHDPRIERLRNAGYETLISIGDLEENPIGSNCGQYVHSLKRNGASPVGGYKYEIEKINDEGNTKDEFQIAHDTIVDEGIQAEDYRK